MFSWRSYSDPDYRTPEEYEKERWTVGGTAKTAGGMGGRGAAGSCALCALCASKRLLASQAGWAAGRRVQRGGRSERAGLLEAGREEEMERWAYKRQIGRFACLLGRAKKRSCSQTCCAWWCCVMRAVPARPPPPQAMVKESKPQPVSVN